MTFNWLRTRPRVERQRRKPRFEDCTSYHTLEFPSCGLVRGPWDLRGRESEYTGSMDFSDVSRVLWKKQNGVTSC
jgi:hypothetical protein